MTPVEQARALWAAFMAGGAPATLGHVDGDRECIHTLHTCEPVGDHVVVAGGRVRVVSPTALSDTPLFWLYRMRDGCIESVESFASRRAALDAARAALAA